MVATYTVTGVQTDEHTLRLDEDVPLLNQRLRIVIEPVAPMPVNRYAEVMASIREAQGARGHVARTKEEIDTSLQAERDSWDD